MGRHNQFNDSQTDNNGKKGKRKTFQFKRSSSDRNLYLAIGDTSDPNYIKSVVEMAKVVLDEKERKV